MNVTHAPATVVLDEHARLIHRRHFALSVERGHHHQRVTINTLIRNIILARFIKFNYVVNCKKMEQLQHESCDETEQK